MENPYSESRPAKQIHLDFDTKGKFNVAASYAKLIAEKAHTLDRSENNSAVKENKVARVRCWHLTFKTKIRHFIWRCVSGVLSVSCNVVKRGVRIESWGLQGLVVVDQHSSSHRHNREQDPAINIHLVVVVESTLPGGLSDGVDAKAVGCERYYQRLRGVQMVSSMKEQGTLVSA
ncbi:ribonuclease H-like superfamily protein [Striga asiatica]|uniref:Ribonuclease H-like superfamily protein n=1 Tax=Striga asiatica TaxID=4170 RepID=A0A5A7Q7V2_STRAF|nr:ribonuclease H-like superfamily protein [Striga asiatica]